MRRLCHALAAAAVIVVFAAAAHATTYTVTNTDDSGPGSLRQAMLDANANPGADTIAFSIGSGVQRIRVRQTLPYITDPLTIDGTTQPGYAGKPIVVIYSLSESQSVEGLRVRAPATTFRALCIQFTNAAMIIMESTGTVVTGCWFSVEPDGTAAAIRGIAFGNFAGTASRIGGPAATDRNVVVGSFKWGIQVGANSTVQNNYVGLLPDGHTIFPNDFDGIEVGGSGSTFGGSTITGNSVAGNLQGGISLSSDSNIVRGNRMGVGISGESLPNHDRSLSIHGSDNVIGGSAAGDANIIGLDGAVVGGSSLRNRFTRNRHIGNIPLIDLFTGTYPDGRTPNDPGDADSGPNTLQNFPVITSANSFLVTGTLDSTPNRTFTIELFWSADGTDWTYAATTSATTDGSGNAGFSTSISGHTSGFVAGTATDADGNTSEFSNSRAMAPFDGPILGIGPDSQSVVEGSGTVSLTVTRTGGQQAADATYSVTDSGTGPTITPKSGTVSFAAGEPSKTIVFNVVNDAAYNPPRTAHIHLSAGPPAMVRLDAQDADVSVADDDPPAVLTISDASIAEGNSGTSTVEVRLTLSNPMTQTAEVSCVVHDGTAVGGLDYSATPRTLVFSPGETTKTLPITILGDESVEPNETFTIEIQPTCCAPLPAVGRRVATVTILNDDFGFGPSTSKVAKGGTSPLFLRFGQPASGESIALASSAPGTAAVPASIALAAGATGATFDVTGVKAGMATIRATLPPSLGGATLMVTVQVYEPAKLMFTPSALTMAVGTSRSVTLSMTPPPADAATITLAATDPATLDVPQTIVIHAGGNASLAIKALRTGNAGVRGTLPPQNGELSTLLPVDVTAEPQGPYVSDLSPTTGPVSGGTRVTINGLLLTPACGVAFGGVPATEVAANGTAGLMATTPAHAPGTVDVLLTCGADTFNFAHGFTYVPAAPTIAGITPNVGSIVGGTLVRIAGANFRSGCGAFFDDLAAHGVMVEGPGFMIAVAPPHAAGAVDVRVRCGDESATLAAGFIYAVTEPPASIVFVDPLAAAPGEPVKVAGTHLRDGDIITFGDAVAMIVSSEPDTHVVLVPSAPPGNVSVTLTDIFGHTTTTGPLFTILEPVTPQIASISPTSGPAGSELAIEGRGFRSPYVFVLGDRVAQLVSRSFTRAIVRVSALDAASYPVSARNAGGATATIGPSFTVVAGGVTVGLITPSCATTDGGTPITIAGTGFEAGAGVTVNGIAASDVTVVDASTIHATLPSLPAGMARVVVTNPGGASGSLSNGLRVYWPFDPDAICASRARPARR